MNSYSCNAAAKWATNDIENTAKKAKSYHSTLQGMRSCQKSHTGNLAEMFIWEKVSVRFRDLGNRASPPSHKNTSKFVLRILQCCEILENGLI